jgi:hypothetical protein
MSELGKNHQKEEKFLIREIWHDWIYASLQGEPTPTTARIMTVDSVSLKKKITG